VLLRCKTAQSACPKIPATAQKGVLQCVAVCCSVLLRCKTSGKTDEKKYVFVYTSHLSGQNNGKIAFLSMYTYIGIIPHEWKNK